MLKLRIFFFLAFVLLAGWALVAQHGAVEAVEIGRGNTALLPKGKEADGIIGDFVLRNNKVHALISGAQPLRRANMRTENNFVTQGCLYDLDLRDENNDQITAFRPGNFGGEVSWVRIVENAPRGSAAIEAVRTAPKGDGLYTRHEYRLEQDWQYILVTSTYRNESKEAKKIQPRAAWRGFEDAQEWELGEVHVGDSVDPFDKRAYAWGPLPGNALPPEAVLQPGEEKSWQVALAVADSPLAAYGVLAELNGKTGTVAGTLKDPSGAPAIQARLVTKIDGKELPHYPDAKGNFAFHLPPGEYSFAFEDIGRDPAQRTVTIKAGAESTLEIPVSAASTVTVHIRDEAGNPSPAKVQFLGMNGTATPNFGNGYRVHGSDHQYQTHNGQFTQQVPPGDYLLRITRGPEYSLAERQVHLGKGEAAVVDAEVRRTLDTRGWVATDFHSHSTESGDNYCRTEDRLINLVAEGIEFAPTTEHNRLYDWSPKIQQLGLQRILKTIVGLELTGSGEHLNAFPFQLDPFTQDGGAPVYNYDPRLNAMVLRNWGTPTLRPGGSRNDTYQNARVGVPNFGAGPERWVQINHPNVGTDFFDRNRDGVEDGGYVGLEKLLDAAEFYSADILRLTPYLERAGAGGRATKAPNRIFGWLQLLNQGRHLWCVAVSDAHRIFGGGAGGWRTYIPSSTDQPSDIDPNEIIRNAKAGRMVISNGPFLEVTTGDGLPIGSSITAMGGVQLKIRVQAPDWMDIDRVQILLSGRQPKDLNFTKKRNPKMFKTGTERFHETITVPLQRDENIIVVATSESSDLSKWWGRDPHARLQPVAFTNPIYVDVDRDGFHANGDTLGAPLMTGTVQEE